MDSKWSGGDVLTFLNLYKQHRCLWDITSPDYLKKDLKKNAFDNLLGELEANGLPINEERLRRKIKIIRDTYRNELIKIKKSRKRGSGTEHMYKPKLMWFSVADTFLKAVVSSRKSSSELDLSQEENGAGGDSLVCADGPEAGTTATPTKYCKIEKCQVNAKLTARTVNIVEPNSTTKYRSQFESATDKSQGNAQVSCGGIQSRIVEDQYDLFAKHIACQLRELPIRSFIILQDKIQKVISQERLAQMEPVQPQIVYSPNDSDSLESNSNSFYFCDQPHPQDSGDIVQ